MMLRQFFDPIIFGADFVLTFIAVIFCYLIYVKTKESYELTKHKGIMYFRDAFVFFGLSYVFKLFFGLLMLSTFAFDFFVPRHLIMPLMIVPLGYFSTIGILYLIFSSIWKKFQDCHLLIYGHTLAVLLSIVSFITRSHLMLTLMQFVLLLIAVVLGFALHKGGKVSKIKVLYLLVAVLWLLNLVVVGHRGPFFFGINIFFQALSLLVFAVIYQKITKWVK